MTHPIIYATFQKPNDPVKTVKKNVIVAGQKKNIDDNNYEDSLKVKKVTPKQSLKITDFRTKYNMSREDFAKAVEMKATIITSYENGTAVFSPQEWSKINTGIDRLIREKEKEKLKEKESTSKK